MAGRSVVAGIVLSTSILAGPAAGIAKRLEAFPVQATVEESLPGYRLLSLCGGIEAGKPIGSALFDARCVGYFQGVVDALETLRTSGLAVYCVPRGVTLKQLIMLYKREAAIYPQVLGVRASDLIAGMIAKFFPCDSAGSRGDHLGGDTPASGGTADRRYASANGITPGMSHFSHISSIFAWKYSKSSSMKWAKRPCLCRYSRTGLRLNCPFTIRWD